MIFLTTFDNLKHSNTSKEKRATKRSRVVVCDGIDYLLEAEKQLSDYKERL